MTVLWFKIPLIALLWRCPPLFHCSYWYLHTATTSSPLPPPSPAPLCPSVSAVPELGPQSRHCTLSLTEPAGHTTSSYKTDVASWWNCLREAKIAGEMEASVVFVENKECCSPTKTFFKVWMLTKHKHQMDFCHHDGNSLDASCYFRSHFSTWMNWYLHRLYTNTCCFSHACGLISESRAVWDNEAMLMD